MVSLSPREPSPPRGAGVPAVATKGTGCAVRFGSRRAAATALPVYSNIFCTTPARLAETARACTEETGVPGSLSPSLQFLCKCPRKGPFLCFNFSRGLRCCRTDVLGGRQEMSQLVYSASSCLLPGSWLSEGMVSWLLRSLWLQVCLWMSAARRPSVLRTVL